MCDTMVRVEPDRVLFAKNSDRDANEAQLLDWQPARNFAADARVRCTWIEIPQARATHAVLLSRPYWMWGAEMGANEYGVVIGNEAVFTRRPVSETGLTGMDLLRLALERSASAEQAVDVLLALLREHGQGGGCGHESRSFRYHSSFLVADPGGAFVVETADREAQTERVQGARSISNGLTLEPFRSKLADPVRTRVADADSRRGRTQAAAGRASGLADLAAALRDHGEGRIGPRYAALNGAMGAPCVHAGGLIASSQTTASWISELRAGGVRHFATATGSPCTALFKPVEVATPLDLGPEPDDQADADTLWWRHERFARRVLREPERLLPLFTGERDATEAEWFEKALAPGKAFRRGDALLMRWGAAIAQADARDVRPLWARRFWRVRDRRAGLA